MGAKAFQESVPISARMYTNVTKNASPISFYHKIFNFKKC